METKNRFLAVLLILLMVWTFFPVGFAGRAQDFIISGDIAGSSSVFSFPKSRKSPKKYGDSNRSSRVKRTKVQRAATRNKIRNQYDKLDKVSARREKIEIIKPEDLIPRQDPVKASLAMTGAAQYYFNDNQVEKSIEYYREAYKLDEKNDFARLGLSDSLTRKGDELMDGKDSPERIAETFYLEAIKLNPENSAAYAGLGEVYDELNESEKAIQNYEKALKIDSDLTDISAPLGILYYQTGKVDQADLYLKKALALEPNDSQTQYFLGLIRLSQDRYKEAETAFLKSIAADPEFAEAYYSLGSTYGAMNKEPDAIKAFLNAVRVNPKYVDAWFDLGAAYFNTGEYQKSIDAYLQTVKLKNDYVEAYINLADSYRQLAESEPAMRVKYGLYAQAISRYSLGLTLIKNNPKLSDVYTRDELGDIYSRYGYTAGEHNILSSAQGIIHNWDKSIDALTKAAEIKNEALDYANLGWAYYNSARIDLKPNPDAARKKLLSAKTNLEKARSMNPNQVVLTAIQLNLGITSIDLGDYNVAIDNLKPVANSRSDWAFSNYSLGVAYFKGGDLNNAISQFKKAIEKDGTYVAALSGLGNAYLLKNDQKEVKKVIEQLKKIGTGNAINEANSLQFALSMKN